MQSVLCMQCSTIANRIANVQKNSSDSAFGVRSVSVHTTMDLVTSLGGGGQDGGGEWRQYAMTKTQQLATIPPAKSKCDRWSYIHLRFPYAAVGRQQQMATTMTLTTATNWTKGIFKLFENKLLTLFSKRKYFKERLAAWLENRMEWWIPKIKTWQKFYTQKVKTLQRRAP